MKLKQLFRLARRFSRFNSNRHLTRFEVRRKTLTVESLEYRQLLAIDSGLHNPAMPTDVDGDGRTTSKDLGAIIAQLNQHGAQRFAIAAKMVVSAGLPNAQAASQPMFPDVNGDGLISPADAVRVVNAINAETLAQVQVEVTDSSGNILTRVQVGQDFELRVYVDDVRPGTEDQGVFSAYVDVAYQAEQGQVTGPITYGDSYTNGRLGETTDGLIHDAGAFTGASTLGPTRQLLFKVPMKAETVGTLNFQSSLALDPGFDFTVYELDDPLTADQIDFGATSVDVFLPTMSIADAQVTEGDDGTQDLVFTISIDEIGINDAAVFWETEELTGASDKATAGVDFIPVTGISNVATIMAGQLSTTVTVKVNGDLLNEANERLRVKLLNPVGAVLGTSQAIGTIVDNDPQPTVSIEAPPTSITEGSAGSVPATFTVRLSAVSGQDVTVDYETVDGSATANSDYEPQTASVVIPAGQLTATFAINVIGDSIEEDDEDFLVRLTGATNAVVSNDQREATATILDDDLTPTVSISSPSITEGNQGDTKQLVFVVTVSGERTSDVSVTYQTQAGTATEDDDYVGIAPTVLTFAPNETQKMISVTINGDNAFGVDEIFSILFSNPQGVVIATGPSGTGVGTILNDDAAPLVSIADPDDFTEPATTENLGFVVTLVGEIETPITVNYNTSDVTAKAGEDYTATSGSLTFVPGEPTSQTINVPILADNRNEDTETFKTTITSELAEVEQGEAIGTILDDNDPEPTLSIVAEPQAIIEGNAGTKTIMLLVSLSEPSGKTVTVNFSTVAGTATSGADENTPGADFVGQTDQTLTFEPGDQSKMISVTIIGDTAIEINEAFQVVLDADSVTGAVLDNDTANVTITNDDLPTISITSAPLAEGDTGEKILEFVVTLSAQAPFPITLAYATADRAGDPGTRATAGEDYTSTSGTLTFEAGVRELRIPVNILGDLLDENDEEFDMNLTDIVGATPAQLTATATIIDDDTTPTVTIDSVSKVEGDAGTQIYTFTVTLSAHPTQTVTINYTTEDDTATSTGADADYAATSGTLTFAPADPLTKTIEVIVNGDETGEPTESFKVKLTVINGVPAALEGIGTIVDDDSFPVVNITADKTTVSEADAQNLRLVTYTVTLDRAPTADLIVNLNVTGAATSPGDFAAPPATLTFVPTGSLTQTFTVQVNDDTVDDPDEEPFTIGVSSDGATTGPNGSATVAILDNDNPTVSIDDASVVEGDDGIVQLMFKVRLSAAVIETGSVTFTTSTENGDTATAGVDYQTTTITVTFTPEDGVEKMVSVPVIGDVLDEANETFTATLSNLVKLRAGDLTAIGTITDDDQLFVNISANKTSVSEGDDAATRLVTFTVTLDEDPTEDVTVNLNVTGTATSPDDFTAPPASVTFLAGGPRTQTFTVQVIDDLFDEPDTEQFTITLASPVHATLGPNASATVAILDNDVDPSVSIDDAFISEGDAGITMMMFRVRLSTPATQVSTVKYATSTVGNNTAQPNIDYESVSGTLTFNIGESEKFIGVPIIGDTVDEANETFTVTLSEPNKVRLADGSAIGTIQDDDTDPTVSIASSSIVEGNDGTSLMQFLVTLSAPAKNPVGVTVQTFNGTGANPATAGQDYQQVTQVVNFAVGETQKMVSVPIIGDLLDEADEIFTLQILQNSIIGALAGNLIATGTIADDDEAPTMTIDPTYVEAPEGAAGTNRQIDYYVRLSGPSGRTVSGVFNTFALSATAGVDFLPLEQFFTLLPGQTEVRIPVTIIGDSTPEQDETFRVFLSNVSGATAGAKTQVDFIIRDDDPKTSLSGTVYQDQLKNGIRDAGDIGIAGVAVTLMRLNDQGQVVETRTTTTDGNGLYQFNNLLGGQYMILETQPAGYSDGAVNLGTGGLNAFASSNRIDVTIGSDPLVNYDFGEFQPPPSPSSISRKDFLLSSRR